jgi:hypothetical protein
VTDPWGLQPLDTWDADAAEGARILAVRTGSLDPHRLRIEVRTPVTRGTRTDTAVSYAAELDPTTTAVLAARAGYDALHRDLDPTADPVGGLDAAGALLELAAAHRDPALVAAAVTADRRTGSSVRLRVQ